MSAVSYTDAAVPVREGLTAAHDRFWQRLARAGAWFTGAERVAIAREARHARHCDLCARRRQALAPSHVEGPHETATELPLAIVDVVHRVMTDPGRLTRKWYAGILEQGLTPEQYVEIIGTVSALISVDDFCYGIGVDHHPLPTPEPGEPSRYRPASAVSEGAWVAMIPVDGATGTEADLWDRQSTGNVIRAMSLVPDEVRTLNDLLDAHYIPKTGFMDFTCTPFGALTRLQMEVIASRVSARNGCFY